MKVGNMTIEETDNPDKSEDISAPPDKAEQDIGPSWEADLDGYPIRPPDEDPRWVVRILWIWLGVATASILFVLVLLILGAITG